MNTLTIVIMLILFVLAMIFVFSTALLTPYIGVRNFLAVVGLGLVVGVVGGAFLLSPIVDDIPDFSRTIIEDTVEGSDHLEMNLSTNGNLTEIIQNISSINGVENINYDFIEYRMNDDFDNSAYRSMFFSALNNSNDNISSIEDMGDSVYRVHIKEGGDPQSVLSSIYDTFKYQNYVSLRYTAMPAQADVNASNVTNIMNQVNDAGAIITSVTGPTEDRIEFVESHTPNSTDVILLSGVLGVIVALAGFFIDSLYSLIDRRRRNRRRTESSRDRIKRKTIPETDRNRRSFSQDVPRNDSIDIFDDSFEESNKQNIGSNRNFEQLEQQQDEKPRRSRNLNNDTSQEVSEPAQESEGRSRLSFLSGIFSRFRNRSNNSQKEESQIDDDLDTPDRSRSRQESKQSRDVNQEEERSSQDGSRPRIRPRRRE